VLMALAQALEVEVDRLRCPTTGAPAPARSGE
jgi:hypothetical protein